MMAWLPSITRESGMHVTSLGKGHNSKCEVQFLLNDYHFHTIIQSKHSKSNNCKSGTICEGKWVCLQVRRRCRCWPFGGVNGVKLLRRQEFLAEGKGTLAKGNKWQWGQKLIN